MRILVLGGTSFVGRAIVEAALNCGHEITLFNRGRTGTHLFPGVARLVGDRSHGDYEALSGRSWDTVVDVNGYLPRHVREAADVIGDEVSRYLFISTKSVYDWSCASGETTESGATVPPRHRGEQMNNRAYGPLKMACEIHVRGRYQNRATIVRPGVVAGPYDPTDRFTWWVRKGAGGGRVALPCRPDQPVQVVDSCDLAQLAVSLLEDNQPGVYNAVGSAEAMTLAGLLEACAEAAGNGAELVPRRSRSGAAGCPLVSADPSEDVMFRCSTAAAHAAGMPSTPLVRTAQAVLAWDRARGLPPLSLPPW